MSATRARRFSASTPSTGVAWWQNALAERDGPAEVLAHMRSVAVAYDAWRDRAEADPKTPPFTAASLPATPEEAGRFLQWAASIKGWHRGHPSVTFDSERGGRVQYRIVAELPHELDGAGRREIVERFAAIPTKDGPVKLPYTAVAHAPDAHNDPRNFHLHLIYHDRPVEKRDGQWDFTIAEAFNHKGEERIRYPHRQPKAEIVAQSWVGPKERSAGQREFVHTLRERFAEISNDVLRSRRVDKVYDARRYKEMGIDRTPTEHLGTRAAALEAVGVVTPVGARNARKIWDDAERQLERDADIERERYRARLDELSIASARGMQHAPDNSDAQLLRDFVTSYRDTSNDLAEARLELRRFELVTKKARSRALRTRQTCAAHLTDIEHGRAPKTLVPERPLIERRDAAAAAHLARIDSAVTAEQPTIDALRALVEQKSKVLKNLDERIFYALQRVDLAVSRAIAIAADVAAPTMVATPNIAADTTRTPGARIADSPVIASPGVSNSTPAPTPATANTPPPSARTAAQPLAAEPATPAVAPTPPAPPTPVAAPQTTITIGGREVPIGQLMPDRPPEETRAEQTYGARWQAALNRIQHELLIIRAGDRGGARAHHTVEGLTPDERDALFNSPLRNRGQARLEHLYQFQEQKITRLRRWLQEAMVPAKDSSIPIATENGKHRINEAAVPQALRGFARAYGGEPEFQRMMGDAVARRAIAAQAAAEKKRIDDLIAAEDARKAIERAQYDPASGIRRAREEAARRYPDPKVAKDPDVRAFIEALREARGERTLDELVRAIMRYPSSIQEAQSHGDAVTEAYKTHERRIANMASGGRADRGRDPDGRPWR